MVSWMRLDYRVEEVMTRNPASVKPDNTVMDAVLIMDKLGIGALPVVDENGRLIGIFTERDLLRRVVARRRNPEKTLIRDVMTPNPVTVKPDESVAEALRIMSSLKVRHLPVVNDAGILVGIVSIKDIEFVQP
ncbi:MAG: CBS domain-containing protein [Desulfurococcales archaeon]|nr:CBS domain-containing protein [Desulfurococcales archaeon]